MPWTIEAPAPFDYRVIVLPAVRTYLMGEIYDVMIEDEVGEIPNASFKLLTAVVDDEDWIAEDVAVEIQYNGAARFQGIVTRILRREDSPVWEVECEGALALLEDEGVLEVEEFADTVGEQIILALLPPSWALTAAPMPRMDFKNEYSTVLEAVRKIAANAGFELYAAYANPGWLLYAVQAIGSQAPVATWQINRNIYATQREQDRIRNPTVAVVPGATADTQDRGAVIARFGAKEAVTMIDEPWITASIDESETTIPCSWTDGLVEAGYGGMVVQIGTERIAFTGADDTSLSGCTRGYQHTTAAPHDAGDSVMRTVSLPLSDTTDWPAVGSCFIGLEEVRYSSVEPGFIVGLSRGNPDPEGVPTPAYGHRAGVLVVLSEDGGVVYSKSSPQAGSPIATYGVRTVRIDGTGLNDQSALDLAATRRLLNAAGTLEGGTAKLADTSFRTNLVTGDHVAVIEADLSATTTYRITGMRFEMATATIELSFGMPRSFFREDLKNYNQTRTRSDSRAPLGDLGTVALVAADETTMLVTKQDGSQVWVKCGLRPAL